MAQKLIDLPTHENPTKDDRRACAPYNFVPLPEVVVPAVDSLKELPDHDRYHPDRRSGYFDVTLTTMSPVYVRGPLTTSQFNQIESGKDDGKRFRERAANRPEFYHTGEPDKPLIPGSSLRGMLRAVLEIVSYSKIQWVTDKKLFFRTVDKTSIGEYYRGRMVEELGKLSHGGNPRATAYRAKVEAGFVKRASNGQWYIEPCDVARVEMAELAQMWGLHDPNGKPDAYKLYETDGREADSRDSRKPGLTPSWKYQHQTIWAEVDAGEHPEFFARKVVRLRNGRERERHPDLYLIMRRATNLSRDPGDRKRRGTLVLTGNMQYKHMAFLFLELRNPEPIWIPNDPDEPDINKRLLDLFHDDDQITQWQRDAFPDGQPGGARRVRPGGLRDGEPVFFLREGGKLTFLGRAQMFRLPYRNTPLQLVPAELRDARVTDYAEALFGYLRGTQELREMGYEEGNWPQQGDKVRGYAGRVFVTDAVLDQDGADNDIWLVEGKMKAVRAKAPSGKGQGELLVDPNGRALVPKILASPKPTAFQMYLTQQDPDNQRNLDHYDSPPPHRTTLRGTKRYWHQGLGNAAGADAEKIVRHIREREHVEVSSKDTQHTLMKPLKPGVKFRFRVHFENLNPEELGALCWALHPFGEKSKECYHHLGMGKPLGMGSVKLEATLRVIDRERRYQKLFADQGWETGEDEPVDLLDCATLEQWVRPFEQKVLKNVAGGGGPSHLYELDRIKALLTMMEWPGFRAKWDVEDRRGNTRYMRIDWPQQNGRPKNEYRYRPVLPDPLDFAEEAQKLAGGERSSSSGAPGSGRGERHPASSGTRAARGSSTRVAGGEGQGFGRSAGNTLSDWATVERGELVRLVGEVRNGNAIVRTEDGHEVRCDRIPARVQGQVLVATVRRRGGSPVSARFRCWGT